MDGVIYLMLGTKHAEHLAISLFSLRQQYSGPVAIVVGDPEAAAFCSKFAKVPDVRLIEFDWATFKDRRRGSGPMYLTKTVLHQLSPFDRTLFLDADTMVTGPLDALWPQGDEVVLTQFANWVSTEGKVKGRIEGWRKFAAPQVERMLKRPHPAINTGVMSWSHKSAEFLDAWNEMTRRNICFMCDELAAQLIFPDYPCRVLDERWNFSPVYSWPRYPRPSSVLWGAHKLCIRRDGNVMSLADRTPELGVSREGVVLSVLPAAAMSAVPVVPSKTIESMMADATKPKAVNWDGPPIVCVWHGHGFKFIKKPQGRAVWWPMYQMAIDMNWCGIAEWTPYNRDRWKLCKLLQYLNNPEKYN